MVGTPYQKKAGIADSAELAMTDWLRYGGGGIHGMRSLEGTFPGGCIITGRVAGNTAGGRQ